MNTDNHALERQQLLHYRGLVFGSGGTLLNS